MTYFDRKFTAKVSRRRIPNHPENLFRREKQGWSAGLGEPADGLAQDVLELDDQIDIQSKRDGKKHRAKDGKGTDAAADVA